MKKIFAISVLSVMAVVATSDAWATDAIPNYNLATVNYVEEIRGILDNNISNRVHTSDVADSNDTVTDAYKDEYIPTVARMEAAIANAKPDTSGLVAKTQVVTSEGDDMNGNPISGELTPDQVVPTFANVEANFAPRIGDAAYDGRPGGRDSTVGNIDVTNLPRGEYSVIVSVDDSGNVSFRWVPIQIGGCDTTVGGTCAPS
ncbi:MAG: hypothetical protein IKA73_03980 [Alphaproteobacteria bacterium]|nr:hypothetical protein [Alphaproteobacteria bacterium]